MSGGLLAVLPIITHDYADACVASILNPDSAAGLNADDLLIVDNTREGTARYGVRTYRDPDGHNCGVARSWNVGAREVLERGLDYLVIVSASMLFGPILHTTWVAQMQTFWGAKVIEGDGLSWKLIAIHRSCFERIGLFDPAFWPGYFEQIDWCYRLRMVGWEQGFIRVWCNAMAQSVGFHAALCPAEPLLEHYRQKWGGDKGQETWVQPYGDKPLDYIVEEPIPVLAERYGLSARGIEWW